MWHFNYNSILFLLLLAFPITGCSVKTCNTIKAESYVISSPGDAGSERWAEYLFQHLSKRTENKSIVILNNKQSLPKNHINIFFELDNNLKADYQIKRLRNQLHICARDNQTALWFVYQLISSIAAEDDRFTANDLSPALTGFSENRKKFDFTYREPHFAPNLEPDYAPVSGTNNIETDWGLWGHNLLTVIEEKDIENIYALVNGKRNKLQFSFSSPELFGNICNYIIENYGEGDEFSYRFMIMPEDNDLVCTCPSCTKLGNTRTNATPAVAGMLRKLAERFPKHQFFTTAYRTTFAPPTTTLPENAGVFLSSINLPKGIGLDTNQPTMRKFMKQMETWRGKTPNIYLWDYAANFDDYLTPIPVLLGLQKQFRFFREMEVKGIFLNASGYDYSPFDDVKTFVAGALMMDVDSDITELCRSFFQKKYPVSNQLLFDYYLSLEQNFASKNKPYDMYGGMRQNVRSYLDAEKFVCFYDALKATIPNTKDEERAKLEKLFTALSFTRLQIAYINGTNQWGYATKNGNKITIKPETADYLKALENHVNYPDMCNYKESDGSLSGYIAEWRNMFSQGSFTNALMNIPVQIGSISDEGFESSALFNDGTPGFASDYHQGWHLSSTDDLQVRFRTENYLNRTNTIQLRFLIMEKHAILPPEKIMVKVNGKLEEIISSKQINISGNSAGCNINIDLSGDKNIDLIFIRKQAEKSCLACDEIRILN